jgi:hypothetical protein
MVVTNNVATTVADILKTKQAVLVVEKGRTIGGQTSAEAAGINLNLQEGNRFESLMRPAAVYSKEVQQEPIVKSLGIRANKVLILHEGDCIKVKQRTWLNKKDRQEIHNIQRVQGFSWMANGKDSCWIRIIEHALANGYFERARRDKVPSLCFCKY